MARSTSEPARAVALSLALGLSGVACGHAKAGSDTVEAAPVAVETEAAGERPMPRSLPLTGALVGTQETRLAANATGRVISTAVDRGDAVAKGQVLARLDTRQSSLQAAEAQASLAALAARQTLDTTDCERAEALLAGGTIAKADYDRTKLRCTLAPADRAAATARAGLAQLNVSDGTIRSPFAGAVTVRHVNAGEYVRADTPVYTLVNLDTLRLEVAVPEVSAGRLAKGLALRFRVPAHGDRVFEATLHAAGQAVRPATRDVVVDADVPNGERLLLPGMFASVDLPLAPEKAVVVPKTAVFERDGKPRVFVLAGDRLEERVVELGGEEGELRAVLRGVAAGERVVKARTGELKNGQAAR